MPTAEPGDVVYRSQDRSFDTPVRPGDDVTARVEVTADLGDGRLCLDTAGETVVTGEAEVMAFDDG